MLEMEQTWKEWLHGGDRGSIVKGKKDKEEKDRN